MMFAPMNQLAKLLLIPAFAVLPACGSKNPAPEAPKPAAPAPQNPVAAAPKVDAPKVEAPKVDAPKPAAPTNPLNQLADAAKAAAGNAQQPAPVEAPKVEDLGKVLGGITDGPTAQAAKSKIESLIQQLKAAKNVATSGQLGGDLGKIAGAAAAKAGVDLTALKAEAKKQVDSLLGNASIKAAIGPTLEQLKGLL